MELSSKISVSFFIFLFAFIAYAQDSPQDYVDAHNVARLQVNVPNITWDDTVAKYAQNYTNQRKADCKPLFSNGSYGENIAWNTAGDLTGTDAVKIWVAEKMNYDYKNNSCIGGDCLAYTQVVWKNTTHLGCAKVRCNNGGTFISCNYDPPGNIEGERPY